MILTIIDNKDGTFSALGPHESFKVANAYSDFINDLNPKVHATAECVHFNRKNEHGLPIYPWNTNQYFDGDEG